MQTRKTAIIRLANVKWGTANFGLVSDIKLTMKPISLGRDSYGRTVNSTFDLKVEMNILANDNDSMKELFTIARDYGTNSLNITGYGGDITITNVLMSIEPEINFGGQPSKIKASFDRYISEAQAVDLWLATETINMPAVTNVIDGNFPPSTIIEVV